MTIESCLTTSGLNVLAQAQTGSTITFTKLAIGDGEITNIQAADLTELINTVQDVTITSKSLDGSTTVSFTGTIEQGESGFYYREIGLYALDPDTGDEVLYAYGNKGDEATYIPAVSSSIVISQKVTMAVTVANSDNITVNIGVVEATRDNDYNIFCVNTGVIDESGEPDFMNITQQLVIESTYSSEGISNFNVNTETYFDTATTYGDYVFTYSSGEWLLNDDAGLYPITASRSRNCSQRPPRTTHQV